MVKTIVPCKKCHEHPCTCPTAVPNYTRPCSVCEQVPSVDIDDGAAVHHTDLCGPCTWGEAETIDPENW